MRKSMILLSAVLTTFALVMLYSVVAAYRGLPAAEETRDLPASTSTPEPTDEPAPTQTAVTPEQAARLAAQIVDNSNLLSAESAAINGTNAYKITFVNNDVVYVGLDGQVLSVQVAPVVINVPPPVKQKKKKDDNHSASSTGEGGQSQEDHEEGEHD